MELVNHTILNLIILVLAISVPLIGKLIRRGGEKS